MQGALPPLFEVPSVQKIPFVIVVLDRANEANEEWDTEHHQQEQEPIAQPKWLGPIGEPNQQQDGAGHQYWLAAARRSGNGNLGKWARFEMPHFRMHCLRKVRRASCQEGIKMQRSNNEMSRCGSRGLPATCW